MYHIKESGQSNGYTLEFHTSSPVSTSAWGNSWKEKMDYKQPVFNSDGSGSKFFDLGRVGSAIYGFGLHL